MLKRLVIGLVTGLAIGAIVAVALVQGMGMTTMGPAWAYLFAAVVGALSGMIAGKPIWAKGGQIEAGLKTFFGALLAVGAMFVLRMWVHVNVDLDSFHAGHGEIGELPAVAFPAIGALLAAFFEVDNSGEDKEEEGSPRKRVANGADGAAKMRVGEDEDADEEEEAPAKKQSKR
jgi:hypothetical protein